MKPLVSYIFEHNETSHVRNAGFLKIYLQKESFFLQIHLRSFQVAPQSVWTVYAFILENETAVLWPLQDLVGRRQLLEGQITVRSADFPDDIPFAALQGFWLQSPSAACTFIASLSSETFPKINPRNYRLWEKADILKPVSTAVRKIQRQDMTLLPRKEWYLANNSFLLHGYYNYHHLLIVEEDSFLLLGVPGIYDRREARAAELFGFPAFSSEYLSHISLDEEEFHPTSEFGYYLRKIKR